ncbi:MAG: PQQ-dependent sugar dehydrogenase [Saprospiraceae bacterium]|nr:PQQ-dependent sugar dehydrogenase [Saprospiraceae bacterium]
MKIYFVIIFLFLHWMSAKTQEMALEVFSPGFSLPVDISHAGDESLFITEKAGIIRILFPDGSKASVPFLDIKNRVNSAASERGLLGLCFHPDYKNNGYLYVNYTNSSGATTISRFKVTGNPDVADPASEKIILTVSQPFNNHNAGDLEFGQDGYLYVGMGDGGSGGDPGNRSQDPKNLLGKMLRIDVNTEQPYLIPSDNPWATNTDTLPEIWAFGLRNPWRFSFDRLTGDLWIGDVGQNKWEEINFTKKGTPAINYGWRCYEGNDVFNSQGCKDVSFYTRPVFSYRNPTLGCSVTGGFVYRGTLASRYQGQYIFTDYCSGRFWAVQPGETSPFNGKELADLTNDEYVTLGEDVDGNLYVSAIRNGTIYKFKDPKCSYLDNTSLATVSQVSCRNACDGNINFNMAGISLSYLWSTGSTTSEINNLCPGNISVIVTDMSGCVKKLSWTLENPEELTVDIERNGSVLTASANQDVTFQWFKNNEPISGATGSMYETTLPGMYYAAATNERTCTVFSDTIIIPDCSYLNTDSLAMVIPVTCYDSCDAKIQLANLGNGVSYVWTNGQLTQDISDLCPGSYSVTLTDTMGCQAVGTWTIDTVEQLKIDVLIADLLFEAFANQEVTFLWYKDGVPIEGATGSKLEAKGAGEYYVIATNTNGCIVQSFSIIISPSSLQDTKNYNPKLLFQHNGSAEFSCAFTEDIHTEIGIMDIKGEILYKDKVRFYKNVWHKIPVLITKDGIYFIFYNNDNQIITSKIFIKL